MRKETDMTCLTPINTLDVQPYTADEHARYLDAVANAQTRAAHSYFDQHIIRMDDGQHWVADEGSYETLMQDLVDRIVMTIPAGRSDEY
jgi:hypothetical protein